MEWFVNKERIKIDKEFKLFCKKWELDINNLQDPLYTIRAIEQAFHSGVYYGSLIPKTVPKEKKK